MNIVTLFSHIEDLSGIEKSEYEVLNDYNETLEFRDIYLLHLRSERFLIVDDEFEIIGDGKDKWFARYKNFESGFKFFSDDEIEQYQEALRGLK